MKSSDVRETHTVSVEESVMFLEPGAILVVNLEYAGSERMALAGYLKRAACKGQRLQIHGGQHLLRNEVQDFG